MLKLPRTVQSLSWLSSFELRELDITGARVTSLEGLPDSLEVLHAGGTEVRSLEFLPEGLTDLDVSRSPLRDFSGLPDSLKSLKAMDAMLPGGKALPRLEHLDLHLQRRELLNLKGLPRQLRSLEVSASGKGGVVSLAGIPPDVEDLRLEVARSQLIDLPPTLKHLAIIGPVQFDPVELPEDLISLRLVRHLLSGSIGEQFPYLKELVIEEAPVGPLEDLPRFLESLDLMEASVKSLAGLPSSLRTLRIAQASLPEAEHITELEGLQELALIGWSGDLPVLPRGLKALGLYRSKVTTLDPVPPSLEALDLSGTNVAPSQLAQLTELNELVWRRFPGSDTDLLPVDLQTLVLADSPNLVHLRSVPKELVKLDLSYTRIQELPDLPGTLIELDIRGTDIKGLHRLPASLKILHVTNSSDLDLGTVPESLQELYLYDP